MKSPHSAAGFRSLIVGVTLIFWMITTVFLARAVFPRAQSATVRADGGSPQSISLPHRTLSTASSLIFQVELLMPRFFPRQFIIRSNGCTTALTVNDIPFISSADCLEDTELDLSSMLHKGTNTIVATIQDDPSPLLGMQIRASVRDRSIFAFIANSILLLCAGGLWLLMLLRKSMSFAITLPVLCGIVLRAIYVFATSVAERGFDWEGHLSYIAFMREHWMVPEATLGWETYHPPLYFVLAALWTKIGALLGLPEHGFLQFLSFLFSIVTLACGAYIATMVFIKKETVKCALFVTALATLPGLLFASARVNNDALVHLLMFLGFALLLRAQKKGRERDWLLAFAATALGMLTKLNAITLFLFLYVVLFAFPSTSRMRSARIMLHGSLLTIIIAGWFFALRFFIEEQTGIVGNAAHLNKILAIRTDLPSLLAFSPGRILAFPMINHWGAGFPRDQFLEYLFRSALGTYGFGEGLLPLALSMLFLSLLLTLLIPIGFARSLQSPSKHITALVLPFFLAMHLLFRIAYPFASSQDFRYSPLLIVAVTLCVIEGIDRLRPSWKYTAGTLFLLVIAMGGWLPIALLLRA